LAGYFPLTGESASYSEVVILLKSREYVYAGEPVPQITEREYPEFYLQFQRAILASLKKRGLLNCSQHDRCIAEIEKKYNGKKFSQA